MGRRWELKLEVERGCTLVTRNVTSHRKSLLSFVATQALEQTVFCLWRGRTHHSCAEALLGVQQPGLPPIYITQEDSSALLGSPYCRTSHCFCLMLLGLTSLDPEHMPGLELAVPAVLQQSSRAAA